MRGSLFCVTAVFAAGVLLSACGAKSHENDPRPPVPPVLSVSVADDEILITPEIINRPGEIPVNINQNEGSPINQADREAPAVVSVAISNLTNRDTRLVLEGPVEYVEKLTARGSGSFQRALPTGIYRLSSPASTATKRFAVGPGRVSSSGDLLTP